MIRNKKIKSSTNLNRWRKGDSCLSNPGNDKHRLLALERRLALIKIENKSLTVEAVKAHNVGEENTLKATDVASEDYRSQSCKTFATNFTTCTIPAFETFFEKYTNKSDRHNRMLSIHSVVQEEIRTSNLSENSTSYLCGLMKCLSAVQGDEEDLDATLKLISMVINKANPLVLQKCFGSYLTILDDVFKANEGSRYVLVNLFGCLSVLLRAQQPDEWSYPIIKNVIKKMLDHTVSNMPKIRHSAQYNIAAIMKGSFFMPDYRDECEILQYVEHPISKFVGDFILKELVKSTSEKNARSTLHLIVFLKVCVSSLPLEVLEKIFTKLLQIIHMGDSLVKKCAMEVFLSLFQTQATSLHSDQISCLVRALSISGDKSKGLVLVPNVNDATVCGVWMTVVTYGVCRLIKLDEDLGFRILTSWFDQVVYCWNSNHDSIHDSVVDNVDILLSECILPLAGEMTKRKSEVFSILSSINKGLSLQCQNAWKCVFRTIAAAIQVVGPYLPNAVTESVKKVADFYCDQHAHFRKCVEHTIGKAIASIGVEGLMKVLPIQITGNGPVDGKNLWILPVIKKNVVNGNLCYFLKNFVPLTNNCHIILEKMKRSGDNYDQAYKQYETVELQLWGLFPKFAKDPVDQEQFLMDREFCKTLCEFMKDRDDIRKDIMLGLRNLIQNCPADNPGQMAVYAKNYIPVLFNLFLTKPKSLALEGEHGIDNSHRLVAFNTIKLYLKITPKNVIDSFFETIITKFSDEKEHSFQKKALLGLIREFIPDLSAENIQKTYEIIGKYLPNKSKKIKNSELQKGAYHILQKIWESESQPCCDFINSNLWDIYDMLHLPSRRNVLSVRLIIMILFLEKLPINLKESKKRMVVKFFVQTGVLHCVRENAKRPRSAAFRLLFAIGPAMMEMFNISTKEMLQLFLSYIPDSGADTNINSQIDVIMVSLMKYKGVVDYELMDQVMRGIFDKLVKKSAIISRACLTFLSQAFRYWPLSFMSNFVEITITHLSIMDQYCREVKHRQLVRMLICRLLRKFGGHRVKAAIPETDIVMRKVLKNLMTLEGQKMKERIKRDLPTDDEAYEDDVTPACGLEAILKELEIDEDEEVKKPKKILKNKIYIKEGGEDDITNLLDPSSVFTKARRVRFAPETVKRKPIEEEFSIDPKTGKFIIEEEKPSKEKVEKNKYMDMISEDSLFPSNKKRSLSDEDDSDADMNPTPSKVRKAKKNRKEKSHKSVGAEFKAKRAGGDMKQKGGLMPYAYLKLDRKILNRRFRSKNYGQFEGIVKKGIRQAPRKT